MDKETILKKHVGLYFSSDHGGEEDGAEWHTVNTPANKIYSAMDDYAKQTATEFAELVAYYYEPMGGKPPGVTFQHVDGPAKYSIQELYAIYIERKSSLA